MSKLAIVSFLSAISIAWAASAPGGRSFDGKWTLDKKANNTATVPPPEGLRQVIKTKGNTIAIQSTFGEPKDAIAPLLYLGIMTTDYNLNADGSETVNQVGPFMVTSKTTIDGNKMDTDWVAKHTSGEVVNGHWTRTLSDDGKHMTMDIKETSTQGQSGNATLNFVRK